MFVAIEIQNNDGEISCIVNSYETKNAAAVSTLASHSAVMLTNTDNFVKSECFL